MIRLWFGQPFYMILFVTRDDVALSILNDSVMVRASLYLILFVTYYIAFPMYGCQLWFRCLLIVDIICVVWRRHHDPCLPNSAVLVFSELDCCIRIIDAFFFAVAVPYGVWLQVMRRSVDSPQESPVWQCVAQVATYAHVRGSCAGRTRVSEATLLDGMLAIVCVKKNVIVCCIY